MRVARRAATAPTTSHSSDAERDADRVHRRRSRTARRRRAGRARRTRRASARRSRSSLPSKYSSASSATAPRTAGGTSGQERARGCGSGCGTSAGLRRRSWAWLRRRSGEATRSPRRRLGILRSAPVAGSGDAHGAGRRRRRSPSAVATRSWIVVDRRRACRPPIVARRIGPARAARRASPASESPARTPRGRALAPDRARPVRRLGDGRRRAAAVRRRQRGSSSRSTASASSCGCAVVPAGSASPTWRAGDRRRGRPASARRSTPTAGRRVAWQHVVGEFERRLARRRRRRAAGWPTASNRVRGADRAWRWRSLPADHAALARGLVIGDDRDQPPEMVERFRASGLAHLTAVSGQNVALRPRRRRAAAAPSSAVRPLGR